MAKKSKIARNEQRKLVVERYAEKRLALKKALVDPNSTDDQRDIIEAARAFYRLYAGVFESIPRVPAPSSIEGVAA